MLACLAVGAGGFTGAVLRYLIGFLPLAHSSGFPLATFFINLTGSFCIGLFSQLLTAEQESPSLLSLFLRVGFCGGFTTFSTFALENVNLLQEGKTAVAVLYMALSLFFCLTGVVLGTLIAKKMRSY